MEWSVRPTTLADAEAVTQVLEASYPALLRESYDAAILDLALPHVTKANPVLLSSGTYYLCSRPSGPALGCGGWAFERPPWSAASEPGLAHLRHFATHPDWCGKGIGRAIYECCEETARTHGIREFECNSSRNAEGFYRSLGFRTLEHFEIPLSQRLTFPALLMRKSLV